MNVNPYGSIEPVLSWNQGEEPPFGAVLHLYDDALGWQVAYDLTLPAASGVKKRGLYYGNNIVSAVDLTRPPTQF